MEVIATQWGVRLLAPRLWPDVHNVHAQMLGERRDSEFAAWSMTNVAGVPVEQFRRLHSKSEGWEVARQEIVEEVKHQSRQARYRKWLRVVQCICWHLQIDQSLKRISETRH